MTTIRPAPAVCTWSSFRGSPSRAVAVVCDQCVMVCGKCVPRLPMHTETPLPALSRCLQYDAGDAQLQCVVDECLSRDGVLLARARYSKLERVRPPPSIR